MMELVEALAGYRDHSLSMLRSEEKFFRSLSLAEAIEYAASGAGPHRGIHPHKRRIGVKRLRRSAKALKRFTGDIQKGKSFADLFVITESVRADMKGLGNLWSYDTALRIAFHLGKTFYPQVVFLQAGALKGVKRIFGKMPVKGKTLPVSIFPKELGSLKPFELAQFLSAWGKTRPKSGN